MIGRSASALKITRMERTFPHAGKYEERTRREGLHLWYDVWYSEDVSVARATGEVSVLEGIEIAAPVVKVRSLGADEPVWRAVDLMILYCQAVVSGKSGYGVVATIRSRYPGG